MMATTRGRLSVRPSMMDDDDVSAPGSVVTGRRASRDRLAVVKRHVGRLGRQSASLWTSQPLSFGVHRHA